MKHFIILISFIIGSITGIATSILFNLSSWKEKKTQKIKEKIQNFSNNIKKNTKKLKKKLIFFFKSKKKKEKKEYIKT